jgi:hypothetical protein
MAYRHPLQSSGPSRRLRPEGQTADFSQSKIDGGTNWAHLFRELDALVLTNLRVIQSTNAGGPPEAKRLKRS